MPLLTAKGVFCQGKNLEIYQISFFLVFAHYLRIFHINRLTRFLLVCILREL